MEETCKELDLNSSSAGVYVLPGEPAIVINGVPKLNSSNGPPAFSDFKHEAKFPGFQGFGEWIEGREVWKLFEGRYFSGTVVQFDKETGWYRVVYEDGDSEDLEWHELEDILLPLDITVPLKLLALKVIRKGQKPTNKSRRSLLPYQKGKAYNMGTG
ncbi:dirigent protein 17-like [Rhodamnia argentea]|uniref:Dirigent protein 17-like n=1 Tax=Rhodamnia argentea TaxID=178133 RepID=A0A8B8MYS5_9MYRT|nr:dirigent protein 17-like [Rhodamnia argentea]XP_030515059.1 dirigent protein 17-like [Rhodamnia argentea]